jgi:hypothetical protein
MKMAADGFGTRPYTYIDTREYHEHEQSERRTIFGDRMFSGVPTSGSRLPVIYFRQGTSGSYSVQTSARLPAALAID